MNRLLLVTLVLGALLLVGGCGAKGGRDVVLVEAQGTVTLKGKPLATGIVSLSSPSTGFAASGPLTEGKFVISNIPVGKYQVGVMPAPPTEAVDPSQMANAMNEIPVKFRDSLTSGLTADVPAGGTKTLSFELK